MRAYLKKDCEGQRPSENGTGKARDRVPLLDTAAKQRPAAGQPGVSEGDTPMERNAACGVCSRAMPESLLEMRSKEPLIEITGLSHAFGGLKAVSNFHLSMDSQAVWGLIGPNGAGKTTIFNLITGVYRPDQGRIRFQGRDITGYASHAVIAAGIARTFQNIRLFKSMSVLDNVRCGGYGRSHYPVWKALLHTPGFANQETAIRSESVSILEKFGLGDRANERADALPYGLQRKIELARALLSKPRLLLLDEPGAGMNPAELDQLAELLLWVQEEFRVSILLIEHRMRLVVRLCQKLKVLNFGGTIFEGMPSELTQNQAVVKAYLGEENADSLA